MHIAGVTEAGSIASVNLSATQQTHPLVVAFHYWRATYSFLERKKVINMIYRTPQLSQHSALEAVTGSGGLPKVLDQLDPGGRTDPAYGADE